MEKFDFKFYEWEKKLANQAFLRQPFGDRWEEYTWREVGQMARTIAAGLQALNLPPKSHVGLVSKNCREWVIADLAILMAGYVSVPFFPTLKGKQIREVLELGDVKALFVGKMENWEDMRQGIPKDMPIIAFPHYKGNSKVEQGQKWEDIMQQFSPLEQVAEPLLDDTWTLIFTSGTTGTPKGVILTYRILENTKRVVEESTRDDVSRTGDNHFFSYLPLNHIAERLVVEATCLRYGGTMSFVESLDTFAKNLQDTRPTIFLAVPRIWTKFQLGILSKMPDKKLNLLLKIPFVSSWIKKKLRKALGLGRVRTCVSGAAPMTEAQRAWYRKIGIYIGDGYGMSENCAIGTYLEGTDVRPGSVGQAQPGVELKIDKESGEILTRGPYTMAGYYKNPKKTAEVLKDGWLHTGDQGYLDEEGYLYITGRIKDTFKTSKGKYIVPAPLEWKFDKNPDIEQICVVGLGCPQPIALVVPSEIGAAKTKETLRESLNATLLAVNENLPNYQKISTIVIVKDAWNIENGLMTPTLKVKRNVLAQRYNNLLLEWHEREEIVLEEVQE